MLCQFTVKNYKSIRDELTLDMQAAAITEHMDSIIADKDGEEFLSLTVIYGPNGGGKSNVLEALNALTAKVLRPVRATRNEAEWVRKVPRIPVIPFRFSRENTENPTEFEVFFRTRTAEYRYRLSCLHEVIVYESLDKKNLESTRFSSLFERSGNQEEGPELKGSFKRFKAVDISDNLPLLSYLSITYKNNPVVADVMSWFESEVDFLNYSNPLEELRVAISKKGKIKDLTLSLIKEMDLSIVDFRVEKQDDSHIRIFTSHVVDGVRTELELCEESSGTKKLFSLLPFIANSLISGTTMIIDELDAKIHPVLLGYLIGLYHNRQINKNGAQLIFTSHDLSTMNSALFRRDEIWFVAKGNEENSVLYSLVEFKVDGKSVRKDAKFDKQYLEGKYGADPYLQKIINWEAVDAKT